jgi:hypothetical protein
MNLFRYFAPSAQNNKISAKDAHAVALHMMYYNFCRIHKTLRVTPAMAAGVTDKLWEVSDIVAILEEWEKSATVA